MLRRRWKLLVVLTLVGLALGSLAAVRAADDGSNADEPIFYAANHRLLVDPLSPNQTSLSQAALFATAGEVPSRAAAALGRDRFDVLARIATIEDKDVGTLTLSAVGETPDEALMTATTFADELVAYLLAQDQEAYAESVATAESDVAEHLAVIEALDAQIEALQPEPEVLEDGTVVEPDPRDEDPQLALLEAERSARLRSYEGALEQLEVTRAAIPRAAFTTLEISEPFTISEAVYQRRLRAGRTGEANFTSPDELGQGGGGFSAGLTDNPIVLVIVGALAGLLSGTMIVLTLTRMDHRILSKEEAEEHYGLPVIAEIPRLRRSERRSSDIVSHTEPMSRVAEAYRSLRSSLVYSREVGDPAAAAATAGRRPEVVMVTSAAASEGKTSTAANLAAVLAEGGYSVLAINCDFRRPQLVYYLRGDHEPRKVSETAIDGVVMINHVTLEGSDALPSDVVQAQRQTIERARGRFDVILLDTAPLLATNDANELLPATDLVLIVAHVGRSTKEAGEDTRELLARRGAPVVGIVLVGVRETTSAKSYYYYSSERPTQTPRASFSRKKRARRRARQQQAHEELRRDIADRPLPAWTPPSGDLDEELRPAAEVASGAPGPVAESGSFEHYDAPTAADSGPDNGHGPALFHGAAAGADARAGAGPDDGDDGPASQGQPADQAEPERSAADAEEDADAGADEDASAVYALVPTSSPGSPDADADADDADATAAPSPAVARRRRRRRRMVVSTPSVERGRSEAGAEDGDVPDAAGR